MKTIIYISTVFAALLISCANGKHTTAKPGEHELLYIATSDSLYKYLDVSSIKRIIEQDSTILDYTTLDYNSFKKKYSMNTTEMDLMAKTFKVTYQIASALKSLEDNIRRVEIVKIDRVNNVDTAKYSFKKVMPIDTSLISVGDSSIILMMMEAYDLETDSLK